MSKISGPLSDLTETGQGMQKTHADARKGKKESGIAYV